MWLKKVVLPAPKPVTRAEHEVRSKIRRATSLIAYLIGCRREYVVPDLDKGELTLLIEALENFKQTLQSQLEVTDAAD